MQEIREVRGLFVVFSQGTPHFSSFIRPQSLRNCSKSSGIGGFAKDGAPGVPGVSFLVPQGRPLSIDTSYVASAFEKRDVTPAAAHSAEPNACTDHRKAHREM